MSAADPAALLKLANGCVSKSDFAGAVKHLTDAIAISDTKELRANRAFSWTALERNEEALADAKHCIALAPTFPKGYLRAGRALMAMSRLEEAVTLLEHAAEKMPQDYALQEALEDALQKLEAGESAGGMAPAGGAGMTPGNQSNGLLPSSHGAGGGAGAAAGGLNSSYYYAAVPASERKLPVTAPQRIDPKAAADAKAVANGHVREDIDRKGARSPASPVLFSVLFSVLF